MVQKNGNLIKGWPVYLVFLILIGALIWALKNQPSRPLDEPLSQSISQSIKPYEQDSETGKDKGGIFHTVDTHIVHPDSGDKAKLAGLQDIVNARKTWNPVWMNWYGQAAADFGFSDINGKEHRLSDYRGKDVVVVFWATWCPPCHVEIPHLIELRNTIAEDELAIIAISNEAAETLKRFVEYKNINYTVSSVRHRLPAPFSYVRGIPASFFIDKEGKLKLAVEGFVSLAESQSILRAKN